jgi:hypothetical protein
MRKLIPSLHPGEDAFEDYAFQRLLDKEMESFEEHLLICERCQDTLSQTDVYVALMKAATIGGGVCAGPRGINLHQPVNFAPTER